ncbi:MAG: DUF3617 domain-containing protein [Pseudomonadota bacterium]
MKFQIGIAACVLGLSAGYAHAQTMKPGLWEITTQMQGGSGEMADAMAKMQKEMESMPHDQRKMMQDMMAKQGVQMGAGGGTGLSIKMCMTQEMIDRNEVTSRQADQHKSDCTHTNSPRSGNSMKFSFVCTKPPSSGEGQVTFTSADAYSMKMTTTSMARGKPEKMDMQTNGRWLGSDCGTVKPFPVPKK